MKKTKKKDLSPCSGLEFAVYQVVVEAALKSRGVI